MKYYLLIYFTLLLSTAQAFSQSLLKGQWINYDGTEIIEFIKTSDQNFIGKIIWMKTPNNKDGTPKLDIKNPNKLLRKKPLLGLTIITSLKYENDTWSKGRIYSYKRGGEITFSIIDITENSIKIMIKKGFFSKELSFKRVKHKQ